MNTEQIEHELNIRKSAMVMVVRPGFGTQSESFVAQLSVTRQECPMIFQLVSESHTTIFRADDVSSVDTTYKTFDASFLIRLKGPNDYINQTVIVGTPNV